MPHSDYMTLKQIFLESCEGNEFNKVRSALTLDADVNWHDDDGWTGLHFAAHHNYEELLELLLVQTGVNVNMKDNNKETPLLKACYEGRENIVRRLCQVPDIQLNDIGRRDGRTAH